MKTYFRRKTPLIKLANLIWQSKEDPFFFRAGTIVIKYKDYLFVSAKTELDFFTGSINAPRFLKCLNKIKTDYFETGIADNQLIVRMDKNMEIGLIYNPNPKDFPKIDLWGSEIDWQTCPGDLFEGINQIGTSAGEKDFEGIYISGRYVFGFTPGAGCRYKLHSLSPFEMTFKWVQIKRILNRFDKLKLLRAAKLNFRDMDISYSGIAFDFDNIRIWVSESDSPRTSEKGRSLKGNMEQFSSLILRPTQFLVDLTDEVINEFNPSMGYLEDPSEKILMKIVALTKGRSEIQIDWKNSFGNGTTRIPVTAYGPINSVSFGLNLTNFFNAIKGKCLMGYIGYSEDHNPKNMVYLKEGNRETLIWVNPDYNQKEAED